MKYTFPANYGERCVLVPIDAAMIPLVSGALNKFVQEYVWETYEDWELGYNAIAEIQLQMANNCLQELIDSNDRLYRLLDTAFNGTTYTAGEPPTPPIPVVPPASDGLLETVRKLQGVLNPGWFGIGGQPATLADVVNALRIGSETDADKVLDALDVLSGASSSAVIFNTVRDLFSDVVGAAGEGAILATLIASTIGNAATQGILSGQLDRIIKALDGGGLVAPAGNILAELESIDDSLAPAEAP